MKKNIFLIAIVAVFVLSCTSTAEVIEIPEKEEIITNEVYIEPEKAVSFAEVPDKEWKLIEVYIGGRNAGFNRNELSGFGAQELFTISFDAEEGRLNGTGAPNRYFAPYIAGDNGIINIQMVGSTMMAPLSELQSLREYDYFNYIQKAYSWNIANDNLEILSRLDDNSEIRLVFTL